MKILLVSSYLPYPLHSGGQVRLYNLIKELSTQHEITLVCEMRPHQTAQDKAEIAKICKNVVTVPRKKQWSVKNIVKAATSSQSFLITGHTSPVMQKSIAALLEKEQFDLIHVETFYVMQNVPSTTIPIVLVEHNIEYKVYAKYKDRAPFFLRLLLDADIAKMRKEEESFWKKATALVAVSQEDQEIMEKKGLRPSIVANGVDVKKFSLKIKHNLTKEKKILFIGDFTWIQNIDSATYIIKEVWPQIPQDLHAKLWIVGREIPDVIRNLSQDKNIIFDEQSSTKQTEAIFHEADILLAPIRVGGGTSYKILESMASGTPVVTMQMSADAILAKDKVNLVVGNNPSQLAGGVTKLLEDTKVYERIALAGRKLIEDNYTWKTISYKLDAVYKGII